MPLPEDWRSFIESLNSNGVEYLIVGAAALADFGVGSLGLQAADFVDFYRVIQLGVAPFRIDILTSLTGVTFDQAWQGRVEATVGNTRMIFLGRKELIRNKKRTGRAQDLADVVALGGDETD